MGDAKTVAYLGPEASYTHQASLSTFTTSNYKFTPCVTIPAIFSAVQAGETDFGVVPFYNTTNGAVIATLESFATALVSRRVALKSETEPGRPVPEVVAESTQNDGDARYPDVKIHGGAELPIRQCLVGHKPRNTSHFATGAQQAAKWGHIRTVFSHEQALWQCSGFLSEHLPNAERISVTSTSRAAQLVAGKKAWGSDQEKSWSHEGEGVGRNGDDPDISVAAISSEMAAKMYDVSLLERDIQDHDDNSTRFFVLARKEDDLPRDLKQRMAAKEGAGASRMSMIAFTVSHSSPGALARSLAALEKHQLNAVGIQQRPPDRLRKEDAIFVEVQGSEESVNNALQELVDVTGSAVCLGHWWASA